MGQLVINGGKPLNGRIELRGAKNLVTKAMVASLLADSPSVLKDVPHIRDVEVVSGLLNLHGVDVLHDDDGVMRLDPSGVKQARVVDIDAHAGSSRIPLSVCLSIYSYPSFDILICRCDNISKSRWPCHQDLIISSTPFRHLSV